MRTRLGTMLAIGLALPLGAFAGLVGGLALLALPAGAFEADLVGTLADPLVDHFSETATVVSLVFWGLISWWLRAAGGWRILWKRAAFTYASCAAFSFALTGLALLIQVFGPTPKSNDQPGASMVMLTFMIIFGSVAFAFAVGAIGSWLAARFCSSPASAVPLERA